MEKQELLFSDCYDGRAANKNLKFCPSDAVVAGAPIAMAYVPVQKWKNIFSTQCALDKGTIFADLYLPFKGRGLM